jgi:hypothetical protein
LYAHCDRSSRRCRLASDHRYSRAGDQSDSIIGDEPSECPHHLMRTLEAFLQAPRKPCSSFCLWLDQSIKCDREIAHAGSGRVPDRIGDRTRCARDADLAYALDAKGIHVRVVFFNDIRAGPLHVSAKCGVDRADKRSVANGKPAEFLAYTLLRVPFSLCCEMLPHQHRLHAPLTPHPPRRIGRAKSETCREASRGRRKLKRALWAASPGQTMFPSRSEVRRLDRSKSCIASAAVLAPVGQRCFLLVGCRSRRTVILVSKTHLVACGKAVWGALDDAVARG